MPDDNADVQVTYRFDDQPAVLVTGSWDAQYERANSIRISLGEAEAFLEALLSADRLIYRIGRSGSTIHRITLTEDRSSLMDEAAEHVMKMIEMGAEG